MCQKDPSNRLTSEEAILHPAFESVMSNSPLVYKTLFDADELVNFTKMTHE